MVQVVAKDEAGVENATDSLLSPPPPAPPPNLEEVEEILGYKFENRSLLEEALTHHSYPPKTEKSTEKEFCYERLEYVGDTVLNLLITKEQFFKYPDLPPGPLTRLRAANVDTEKLARVALKLELHKYLRHCMPLLDKQIEGFVGEILSYPLHSNGLVDVPKVLADIVESTIGAVFIDSDSSLDIVWTVFKDLLKPVISPKTLGIHPVTQLFQLCQKRGWSVEFKDLWKESMAYNVLIEGNLVGKATYALKKEIALNRAAKDALDHINEILDDHIKSDVDRECNGQDYNESQGDGDCSINIPRTLSVADCKNVDFQDITKN